MKSKNFPGENPRIAALNWVTYNMAGRSESNAEEAGKIAGGRMPVAAVREVKCN